MAELATALPYSQQVDGNLGFSMDGLYIADLKFTPFTFTVASIAAGDTIPLVTIPGGKIRVVPELSFISVSNTFNAGADGHLGHQQFTNHDQTVVPADPNHWIDNADIGGAAVSGAWTAALGTAAAGSVGQGHAIYDAAEGLTIEVLVDVAASSAASTITGWVAWSHVP